MCSKLLRSANWRIVIPNLQQYKDASSQQLHQLKCLILQRLRHRPQDPRSHIKSQFDRGLHYYHIALQHHANGTPHLDLLLIYDKSIQRQLTDFDYLFKHGNVSTYRKLSAAIINYGKKQDTAALSNLPEDTVLPSGQSVSTLVEVQQIKKDPYFYLYKQMCKDPLHFNLQQYVKLHQLSRYISCWTTVKSKLKDMQVAAANLLLRDKPGFKLITRALIESVLSPDELITYDSWQGYQTVVNYLNEILKYGCNRPFKSKQLLLTGRPNTGKTSLIRQIQKHCAVYHLNVSSWFPHYRDGVYPLMAWNQFKLKGGMAHTDLLKFLEGTPMDLQYKGGSSLRRDNPLIILNSNMTLEQHIFLKFKELCYRNLAFENLTARITQIRIPDSLDLFLLLKCIVPVT